jgi:hypothetical protein
MIPELAGRGTLTMDRRGISSIPPFPVDVIAPAHVFDRDEPVEIVNPVDDAVITNPDAKEVAHVRQRLDAEWSGFQGE